jgi:hypothetical protein
LLLMSLNDEVSTREIIQALINPHKIGNRTITIEWNSTGELALTNKNVKKTVEKTRAPVIKVKILLV